jgi:hypothetical protein
MGKRVLFLAILALAGLVGLTGCGSPSGPSSGQARKVLETAYPGAKIIDFRKLNGEAKVIDGQPSYVYHLLAAFELPAGLGWRHDMVGLQGGFVLNGPGQAHAYGAQVDPIPAGATGVDKGTITFRETEQGWTNDSPVGEEGYCPPKTPPQVCYKKLGWDKLN